MGGQLHLVVYQSAHGTAHHHHAPHQHVHIFAVVEGTLEVRQGDDLRRAPGQRAEREVARHGQQALFAPQEAEALPDVPQQPPGGGLPLRRRGPLRLDVLLLRPDLRLRDGGGEEAHSVDAQQRRDAHLVVEIGGNRDHHRCQRLQHAGDGVGLGVVSLRNKHGVKALVGHHVHAVDGTDDEAPHRQHREAEPPLTEDQRRRGVDARGDKVQRVDGALPGKAVKDGAGKDRRDDLGRRERGDVDGV